MSELEVKIPSMLADAVDVVALLGQKAVQAKDRVAQVPIEHDHQGKILIVKPDGTTTIHEPGSEPRHDHLRSVAEIDGYLKSMQDLEDTDQRPMVFVDRDEIKVLLDEDRDVPFRDQATIPLHHTDVWDKLDDLKNGKRWFTQAEFLRLLRIDLRDAKTDEVAKLIETCKKIDFSASDTGTGEVTRGGESLGRNVTSQVMSSVGEIPEEVELSVNIFRDPHLDQRRTVKAAVEIDSKQKLFSLIPYPSELDAAMDTEIAWILNDLRSTISVPVYYGYPREFSFED